MTSAFIMAKQIIRLKNDSVNNNNSNNDNDNSKQQTIQIKTSLTTINDNFDFMDRQRTRYQATLQNFVNRQLVRQADSQPANVLSIC